MKLIHFNFDRFLCFGLAWAIAMSLGPFVFAQGVGTSGGGLGVDCKGRLTTLDLYEAEFVSHLKLSPPASTLRLEFIRTWDKYHRFIRGEPAAKPNRLFREISKVTKYVDKGSLKLSYDATLPKVPDSCRFVQIAVFDDDQNTLFVDRGLWKRLNTQNQAALFMHEVIYSMERTRQAKKSDDTRNIVGHVFSNVEMPDIWGDVRGKSGVACRGGKSDTSDERIFEFYLFDTKDEKSIDLYFETLDGYLMLSRAHIRLVGKSIRDFLKNGIPELKFPIRQDFFKNTYDVEISPHFSSDGSIGGFGYLFAGKVRSLSSSKETKSWSHFFCAAIDSQATLKL